jgi:protein involved in ribonucleotide reduction
MQWTCKRDGTSLSAVSFFSISGNTDKFLGQIPLDTKSIRNSKGKGVAGI